MLVLYAQNLVCGNVDLRLIVLAFCILQVQFADCAVVINFHFELGDVPALAFVACSTHEETWAAVKCLGPLSAACAPQVAAAINNVNAAENG